MTAVWVGTMKCWEYVGRASATQQRRRCERQAIRVAHFQGAWRPLCRYHVGQYNDLPQLRIESR